MSAFDNRLHILNMHRKVSGSRISAYENILWPCRVYKITAPVKKKKVYNIFEEIVLRLIDEGKNNIDLLHEATCLEKDLLHFIVNKLQHYNLIDKHLTLSAEAKKYFSEVDEKGVEYEAASVFVEMITGRLLPVIGKGELSFSSVSRVQGAKVLFEAGTAGNGNEIRARKLKEQNIQNINVPTPRVITGISRAYNRLREKYSVLSREQNDFTLLNMSDNIQVNREYQSVYLFTRVVVQEGTAEYRIEDPFGFGFSDLLEDSHRTYCGNVPQENDEMIRLLEKGKRGIVETSGSNNRIVIPGFNETALKSQPDIRRLLEHAERAFLKLKTETSGVEIEAEQNTAKYNCAAGLYSAIEWTLRQIVYRFPAGRFDEILKRGSLRENTLMLEEFAGKLGFKLTDNNRLLLNIPKEKFARIANGAAELTPLLGLCITGAFDDFIHPFNQLGREFPELLSFLLDLKEVRDAESHGNLKSLKSLTKNRMAYFRGNVHVLILTLLPELRQTENGEEEEADQDDIIFDRRIAARFEVDKIFGLQTIDNLKPDMREVLVQCELKCEDLKQNRESASHMNAEITKLLASLLQDAVFNRVKQLREKEFNEIGWQVRIKDSVLKAGFRLENDELPESIRYVAQRRIRRACFRISSSLGANLIALIMLSDEGSLKALAEKIPDLIIRADNLLQLRNHGNNELEMPENEVIELKEEIYHITKIFLEV